MTRSTGTSEPDPRWEAFAAREPFFAVLTAPRFRRANLTADSEREFFASGEALVDTMFRTIELRLAPHFAPTSILEYGCGVGRLAVPLAKRAGRRSGTVTAVDRSPAMLEVARHEARRREVGNIEFCTPAELFGRRTTFDFLSCYLVLQRMPQEDGLALLHALIALVAPGGIGVFHLPYRTTISRGVQAARWLRERMGAINGVANLLRGKPFGDPFIGSHAYDLLDVFRTIDEASIRAVHTVFEHDEGLVSTVLYVETPMAGTSAAGGARPAGAARAGRADTDRPIDVRGKIAATSVEELNRASEEYFASLSDWEPQLTKPFSQADETPSLLVDVATLLQGLRVAPGMTVLEFGAGTGWLARFLTQLGCRVILLDVSPTALRMARELYSRLPIIGDRPAPEFLLFDGQHIDLPNGSVERILSFHAFHHAPNPGAMIREFGRLLAPGGIAGFVEPGPRHSQSPSSQSEMRAYGVVENDVNVHEIWREAGKYGFVDLQLAVFHGLPFPVSLQEFEDFLAGGATCGRWEASTRVFLRNVRSFFLFKEGAERADSRRVDGLACEIHATLASVPAVEGQPVLIDAIVTNSGTATWLSSNIISGGVMLGAHLYDASGQLLTFGIRTEPLADPGREIVPGETVRCRLSLPSQRAGQYMVELDCVSSRVTWFAPLGSHPARVPVEVVPRANGPA